MHMFVWVVLVLSFIGAIDVTIALLVSEEQE
jgi:hypothetical protein